MIKPIQQDDVLLADIKKTQQEPAGFRLWWLGQSGYLLQWQGRHLLIDPYLSDSLTHKYAQTDKPHVRMSERVIAPEKLDFIDIVSSSHNHTDHLDGETLVPIIQANPGVKLIIPEANRDFVAHRIHQDRSFPIGLNDGSCITIKDITFHGIPAAHNDLERDEKGQCLYMGYVISFGPYTIYHSGDTLWRSEILAALKPFNIDLALLPINGNIPSRRVAGNLNATEAVKMAKTINAKMVIPCHYHLFRFNTVDPDEFIREGKLQQQAFQVLQLGEKWVGH
ncbi:MAG: MBL fold metallo-hydrolase [Saprospiraceae bacterium]